VSDSNWVSGDIQKWFQDGANVNRFSIYTDTTTHPLPGSGTSAPQPFNPSPNTVFPASFPEIQKAQVPAAFIDFTSYSEDDLRFIAQQVAERLEVVAGPTPPKFATIEEADAWLEAHRGS